jgi:Bax protein
MKLLYKICIAIVIFCFSLNSAKANRTHDYIKKYKPLVELLSKEYGIPRSIITAISIIESGAGRSRNCKLLKNHFGIKGRNNLFKTKGIKSSFKQYETDEASFRDFCELISRRKYYKKLKGNNDYTAWINAIASAGYSTTPLVWKKEITRTIKYYKLSKLDEEETINAS